MARGSSGEVRAPAHRGRLGRVPGDALVVLAIAFAGTAGVLVLPAGSPIRVALGLPLLFFLPGYALLAVCFPGRHDESGRRVSSSGPAGVTRRGTVTLPERLALSVGLSVALVPVVGLVLVAAPVATTPAVIAAALTAVVVVGMARRLLSPARNRYRAPVRGGVSTMVEFVVAPDSVRTRVLNVAVLVVAVLAVVALAGALVSPPQDEAYTDVALVTEDGSGDYVAGGYPDQLAPGESAELVLAVENEEGERTDYTVVVVLERVDGDGNSASAATVDELNRFEVGVDDGVRAYVEHEVTPTATGENLRINYLLYRGEAPPDPNTETAYRHVHVWVDVVDDE